MRRELWRWRLESCSDGGGGGGGVGTSGAWRREKEGRVTGDGGRVARRMGRRWGEGEKVSCGHAPLARVPRKSSPVGRRVAVANMASPTATKPSLSVLRWQTLGSELPHG